MNNKQQAQQKVTDDEMRGLINYLEHFIHRESELIAFDTRDHETIFHAMMFIEDLRERIGG